MPRKLSLLIISSLCLAAAHSGLTYAAYHDGDFQIWNSNTQDIKIGKATKFTVEEEYRYGEGASELFYQHYDFGFAWAFDKRFEIAAGERIIYELYQHKRREEYDIFLNLTFRQDIWNFKFDDRSRFEWRDFHYAGTRSRPGVPNQMRYRNKFGLKYPIEFKSIKIIPYSSDEIFISSNGTGLNQNRFQSGFELELNKYVKFDVSYMFQSIRGTGDKWYTANVLWLKNKISF